MGLASRAPIRRPNFSPRLRRWLSWSRLSGPVALTLVMAFFVDRAIGGVEGGGPYRREIWRPVRAVERAEKATHVVLGCSTSKWFPAALHRAHQLGKHALVDAHMSDCLPACTMAQSRRLLQLGKRFQTATFGVNLFEYCEDYRER